MAGSVTRFLPFIHSSEEIIASAQTKLQEEGPEALVRALNASIRAPFQFVAATGKQEKYRQYATRIFQKCIRTVYVSCEAIQPERVEELYLKKLARGGVDTVSVKHRVLMEFDPLRPLSANPTLLDYILANTHFEDVPDLDRNKVREILIQALNEMEKDPNLRSIMNALGLLIKQEKGNIIFAADRRRVGRFLKGEYHERVGERAGMYNTHHTIVLSFELDRLKQLSEAGKGTFIHEAQHFLFDRLIQNHSSPVRPVNGSQYMDAILKDRKHRDSMPLPHFSDIQKRRIYLKFVLMETHPLYFNSLLNVEDPRHVHILQVESIVRVAQLLAEGASFDDLKEVCPHLTQFYLDYCVPLFKTYVNRESIDAVREFAEQPLSVILASATSSSENASSTEEDSESPDSVSLVRQLSLTVMGQVSQVPGTASLIGRVSLIGRESSAVASLAGRVARWAASTLNS